MESNNIFKYNFNILLLSFIIILFGKNLSKEKEIRFLNLISQITITIKGTGEQNILSDYLDNSVNLPDQIYINNISQNIINIKYNLIDEENDIIMIWNNELTSCESMFCEMMNIIKIDLSKFDSSKVTNMKNMFSNCNALTSINFGNFNTSSVTNMFFMFTYCTSLTHLNLSNFDTSKVTDMSGMFYYCAKLISLNINNFDTSKVTSMTSMFYGCYSLISLNISNFDTSKVFYMDYIFDNCISLIYINIKNFNTQSLRNNVNLFGSLDGSLIYCIDESKVSITKLGFRSINNKCNDDCFILGHKIIKDKKKCIIICEDDDDYKFEYLNFCYSSCPNGTHISSYNNYICEEDLNCEKYYNYNYTGCLEEIPEGYYLNDSIHKTIDKCNIKCGNCTLESMSNNLCISCNNKNNYYEKYNDSSNNDLFINCYNEEFDGYYIDINNRIYKPCYETCKKCIELGNEFDNKCTEYLPEYNIDTTNIYINTETTDNTNNNNNCIYYYEGKCIIENMDYFNQQFKFINKISDSYFYYYDINYNITNIKSIYNNLTFLNFYPELINFLIDKYNLDENNDIIYALLIEFIRKNAIFATSDYDYKLINNNGTILNLSEINEDVYVDIIVPIIDFDLANYEYAKYFTKQGYDIYDKKSNFYNDICSPAYLYENDIILKDRKLDIYPNNITLCKNNCEYKGINIEEKTITCKCNLNINKYTKENKNNIFLEEEDNGNFFSYLLDNINYKLFKCYNLLFISSNIEKNIIFYIIILIYFYIIIINIIFLIIKIPKLRIYLHKQIQIIRKSKVNMYKNKLSNPTKVKKKKKKKISNNKMCKLKIHSNKVYNIKKNRNKNYENQSPKIK